MCLGVAVTNPVLDGVEQLQEGIRYKHFVYSGKQLLGMTDFENKFQNEITQVKGLTGGHTSGWVKFSVGTEDKLYLDDNITRLKFLVLQWHANSMS